MSFTVAASEACLKDLAEFNFKLRNVKGQDNLVADALPRMYLPSARRDL
jgi:hypothetical protein